MCNVGEFRHALDPPPPAGTKLVVRTDRGVELAEVVSVIQAERQSADGPFHITRDRLGEYLRENGSDYPFRKGGKVLRRANEQDIIDHRHLETSAKEEGDFCRRKIDEFQLPMKLVTVEHLLGGERIIFYFTAEHRVDFRELVKTLAGQFRTRIEMRQVGARDEARLVADYERCGQRCCCQQYLKDLKPVSMRMAKTQKATLDPSKISGRCGRLMCCLRYEDDSYRELKKRLPKKNTWVRTEELIGRVIETQTITQLVRLALRDGTTRVVACEDIVERNVPEPSAPPTPEPTPRRARRETPSTKERSDGETDADDAKTSAGESSDSPKAGDDDKPKKKRRRRRKKKPSSDPQASGSDASGDNDTAAKGDGASQGRAERSGGDGQPDAQGQSKPKKKRRRRRRKKPTGQGQGQGQGAKDTGSGS
jgi:cell fate regulator YaaT (PSP1 superfamily)